MSRLVESGIITILFFLVINVVFLNIFFVSQKYAEPSKAASVEDKSIQVVEVCDDACQSKIAQKMSLILPSVQPTQRIENELADVAKEYTITLGTGSTTSKDWIDIGGAEATINTDNYPPIEKVFFEAFLSIPQAQGFAYAKLFNITDKHDVWFSDVSMEADKVIAKTAQIKLDSGNKTYRVMMKSTLGVEVKLHNARIRIITK